jgi:hypothetical protein
MLPFSVARGAATPDDTFTSRSSAISDKSSSSGAALATKEEEAERPEEEAAEAERGTAEAWGRLTACAGEAFLLQATLVEAPDFCIIACILKY